MTIKRTGKPVSLCLVFVTTLFVLLILAVHPRKSFSLHVKNDETGTDYILVGVGVFRQNLTNVDGEEVSFEDSDDGIPAEYSNSSYLSLFGEGQLNNDWSFDLRSRYDQEDPDQEFSFLANFYHEDNYISVGDQENGNFLETTFTASDDEMRGLTLHGEKGKATGTAMAGAIRGESATDEIRGDGTSGRYDLSEAPVIQNSESVRIEVRDRANVSRVIKSTSQARGRDYSIDYDRGELLFTYPVDESDFRGNPIFIVVSYQYDAPGELYTRARYGLRSTVSLNKTATVGASYLAEGPWEDSFSSELIDERQQIYGSDLTLNFNEHNKVYIEVARSESPTVETVEDDTGMRLDFETMPLQDFKLFGNYWRVGKDFLTFGNRDLASGNVLSQADNETPFTFSSRSFAFDLDPNISAALGTDTESYGLSATYDMGFHTFAGGTRLSRDNIPDDSDSPTNHRDSLFASVTRLHPESFDYLLGSEVIFEDSDGEDGIDESQTSRLLGAIADTVGSTSWSGPLKLTGLYQYEQFDDKEGVDESTKIHDMYGRAEIEPVTDTVLFYAENGYSWIYEEAEDEFTQRSDTYLVGVDGRFNRYVELISSFRYKRINDLVENAVDSTEQLYEFRWISNPFDSLRTGLRFEYRWAEDNSEPNDVLTKKMLVGGELFWDATSSLLFTFSYDRELETTDSGTNTDLTSSYDDLLVRIDWKPREDLSFFAYYRIEYDELETEPLAATRVRTTTELVGGKYSFSDRFELVSSYRRKYLGDDVDNEKMKIFSELAYRINNHLSVAPGYEYSRYDQEDGESEYEASILYISLIGKL